jgi:hypothetical protein
MSGYTKLFSSIIGSTIWREDNDTRIVWITMLAMADKDGVVEASVPGLADFSRISVDGTRAALAKLMAPDPDSRSKEFDGRRVEEQDGGWRLLNHAKYRAKLSEIERREYKRAKQAEYRAVDKCGQTGRNVDSVDTSRSRVQKQEVPPNPPTGGLSAVPQPAVRKPLTVEDVFGSDPDDPTPEMARVTAVSELWERTYADCHHGARFRPNPQRDYAALEELASTYGDNLDHLGAMFRFFFLADDLPQWALSRSPKCFLRLAAETDAAVRRSA